jgi:hypothetical protein
MKLFENVASAGRTRLAACRACSLQGLQPARREQHSYAERSSFQTASIEEAARKIAS